MHADTKEDAAALYDAAMDLSRRAFAGRHYAVAYHALAAALHAAYDAGDDDGLVAVAAVGEEQRTWLDDHEPGHALSGQSAASRGSQGLWATLGHEVQTRRQILAQRRTIQQVRPQARA